MEKMNTTNMLEGRCAIVTGAGQGIGRAIAIGLAQHGAQVVVAELIGENGARVAAEINAGGAAFAVQTDVSQEESVNAMVSAAVRKFGRLDILVNNAAIFPAAHVSDMSVREWQDVLTTNL